MTDALDPKKFKSADEVRVRLANIEPLTDEEIEAIFPWSRQLDGGQTNRLQAEVTHRNTIAIREFNRSSTTLTRVMMALVGVQIAVAVLQVVFMVLHK